MKNKWNVFEKWFNKKFGRVFNLISKQGKEKQNYKYK